MTTMPTMASQLPPSFIDISTACSRQSSEVNVMGVVTDVLPPKRSGGTDWMCSFSILDPYYAGNYEQGLKIRFFRPLESELPAIRGTGDVVLIRFLKVKLYQGMTIGLSNKGTTWIVFPAASIPSTAPTSLVQLEHIKEPRTAAPSSAEMRYAIVLCNSRDRTSFTDHIPRAQPTNTSVTPSSSGSIPATSGWRDKFSLLKDVMSATYYDLVGQVVKLYAHSNRVELYLTDYTSNNLFWNYEWGKDDEDGSGREGDEYNYVPRTSRKSKWPGPFGKMTLTVTLWPPHGQQIVEEHDFVHLRNVHIKFSNDSKLEGDMHTDRQYPDRIGVTVLKNHEDDDRVKDVLRRKRDYAKKFQNSSKEFVAEARSLKRKADDTKPLSKAALRKKRRQEREKLGKSNDHDPEQLNDKENRAAKNHCSDSVSLREIQKQDLNKNVNCSNHLIAPRSIPSILSLANYNNKTPEGTSYTLPFQNIKSRATVRVIDFFPSDLVDFAVACPRTSEFACLSDAEDSQCDDETEAESSDAGSQPQREERRWEWRFGLVLEEAMGPKSQDKETITVYVAQQDAECLLKMDAENLRKSPTALAELREKLFLLWGDLEERKQRKSTSLKPVDGNARPTKKDDVPKSKAFQCCLKEYGVKTKVRRSVGREDSESESDQAEDEDEWIWERRWRMFGTTIV